MIDWGVVLAKAIDTFVLGLVVAVAAYFGARLGWRRR